MTVGRLVPKALAALRLGESRVVPANMKVSAASVFSEVFWDMSSHVGLPGVSSYQKTWNFAGRSDVPDRFSLALAEYAYSRMFSPVQTYDREADWLTVHNELCILGPFVEYCRDRGARNFGQLDGRVFEEYLHMLQFGSSALKAKSRNRIATVILTISRVWEFRSALTEPPLQVPFNDAFGKKNRPKGSSRGGNKTPPIPDKVFSAVTSEALNYVQLYGPKIVDIWNRMQHQWDSVVDKTELDFFSKLKQLGRFTEDALRESPSTWLLKDWTTYGQVYKELHSLRAACIIVVLAYSGVRSSELLSIEAGCCVTDSDSSGRTLHYLNTKLHKHKKGGVRDAWVVIEEVVQAVGVLETLTKRVRDATRDQRLMLSDGSSSIFSVHKTFEAKNVAELQSASIVYLVNEFWTSCLKNSRHVHSFRFAQGDADNLDWHFNSRQFRRTLARFIARKPFGLIAGMLQYKHVGVTVFEGYAGAEPEWNKLQEEERVLASVDILEEVALDLSNGTVSGELGKQLQKDFFVEFRGRAEDYPPSQIAKWLAGTKKALFVGKFNFCLFEPQKALCTAETQDKSQPVLNSCQPSQCKNACVSKRHEGMWRSQLSQAEELVVHPATSKYQRIFLQSEIALLKPVVEGMNGE